LVSEADPSVIVYAMFRKPRRGSPRIMYRCLASGWSEFETKTVASKNIKEKKCLVVSESNNFGTRK